MLGNTINDGDTVIIAIKTGRVASLVRAYARSTEFKPQFAGGAPCNMVEVEYSSLHKFWLPASHVVKISDDMLPEKRREKLNDTKEAVVRT